MIRELGPLADARILGAARAAAREGRGVSLLRGAGWGGLVLGVDPVEERRIEHGLDAFAECEVLLDGLSEASDARGWNGLRAAPRWIGYVAYEAARVLERPSWSVEETRPSKAG